MENQDLEVTITRPALNINSRPSGSFIIKDEKLVPNLQDEAMAKREEVRIGKEIPKELPTDNEEAL